MDFGNHTCAPWIEFIKNFVIKAMKDLKGNKVLVIGLGKRTGLATCNFLAGRGFEVTANDVKSEDELSDIRQKLHKSVRIIAGHHSLSILNEGFDFIVLSPGVPRRIPLVEEAMRRNIPVIAEIELAYRYLKGYIIGITGTDGKSTTTALTGYILKELEIKTIVGGNIGIPFISLVDQTDENTISVIELSSFQLETIDTFRPHVAAILNITPDHLDRYSTMEEYALAKMQIAKNQTKENAFVYFADDAMIAKHIHMIASKQYSFSLVDEKAHAFLRDGHIYVHWNGTQHRMIDVHTMKLVGRHNALNAMAAMLMVCAIFEQMEKEIPFHRIAEIVAHFQGLAHRMEKVGEFEGRTFINDSKATTVGAVQMAVENFSNNAVLILGGRTKGDDYSRLAKSLKGKLRALVLIGESKSEFLKIFSEFSPICAETLEDAVIQSMRASHPGDTILLSPACASFDMFTSYEHRGDEFKKVFEKLKKGELCWM